MFSFYAFFLNLKLQSKRNFTDSDYDKEKKILIKKKIHFFVCNDKRFKINKPISKHVFF